MFVAQEKGCNAMKVEFEIVGITNIIPIRSLRVYQLPPFLTFQLKSVH